MPTILPPSRNQLGEVIAELEALGGHAKTDFRITSNRWGETGLEVTDELYEAWEAKANPDAGSSAEAKAEPAKPKAEPETKSNTRKSSGGK